MPACHSHLVCLVDLLHPHSRSLWLDHHCHILASSSSTFLHQVSFATMLLIQRSLRSDAPPQHPCAQSHSWSTQPHTRRGLPSVNIDGFHTLPVCSFRYC